MEEKETITIPMEDGTTKEAEIIVMFEAEDLNKTFAVYTFGEEDDNGMDVIHVSEVVNIEGSEEVEFKEVDKEDWDMVKDLLRGIVKSEEEK